MRQRHNSGPWFCDLSYKVLVRIGGCLFWPFSPNGAPQLSLKAARQRRRASGSAPGVGIATTKCSPEGAHQEPRDPRVVCLALTGLGRLYARSFPGALPQAKLFSRFQRFILTHQIGDGLCMALSLAGLHAPPTMALAYPGVAANHFPSMPVNLRRCGEAASLHSTGLTRGARQNRIPSCQG